MIQTFNKLTNIQKILVTVILSVFLFSASASLTYSLSGKSTSPVSNGGSIEALPGPDGTLVEADANDPKTEECPLNGGMKSKRALEAWEKRRPLAVMIENHTESRPQSGLSSADIVYEAVAEGGITRFMGIFYCGLTDVQVGPVRSIRTYFLDWASELDPLLAHVGGANTPGPADALGQIIRYKTKSLNQFGIGFPTFWRDYQRLGHPVATEHTMYSTTEKLWEVGAKRSWTNVDSLGVSWDKNFVSWKFKDDAKGTGAQKITVNFWESQSDYQVEWSYDSACNCYKRKNGGAEHTDLNFKRPLDPKNIVVQFERESRANDGYENNVHLIYGTTGTGKALIFQDGVTIEGKWSKLSRTARTKYTDSTGKEIQFSRGQIWIQTVPEGAKVTY